MKVIVAGSRDIGERYYPWIKEHLDASPYPITTLISGGARGVDSLGERWAREAGVECEVYPANWNLYGRSAGYRRNVEMAQTADALIAFWTGKSPGTEHMIKTMEKAKKPVLVHLV